MPTVLKRSAPGSRKWLLGLGGSAVAAAFVIWATHSAEPDSTGVRPTVSENSLSTASQDAAPPIATQATMQEMAAQQTQAAERLAARPDPGQVTGPVTERPDFVSPMEWMMLQGAVAQKPNRDEELTRMVNLLRFNKQMELWQGLARTPDTQPRRKALADALLADLPHRVRQDEMTVKDAQEAMTALLEDAEADAARRDARAGQVLRRLEDAAAASGAGTQP